MEHRREVERKERQKLGEYEGYLLIIPIYLSAVLNVLNDWYHEDRNVLQEPIFSIHLEVIQQPLEGIKAHLLLGLHALDDC